MENLLIISECRLYAEGLLALLDARSKYLRGVKGIVSDFDFFLRKDAVSPPDFLMVVLRRKKQLELLYNYKSRLSNITTAIVADQHLVRNRQLLHPYHFDLFCSDQSLAEDFVTEVDEFLEKRISKARLHSENTEIDTQGEGYALTTRERQVLYLISRSYSNKEIGKSLYISDQTVSVHRRNLMKKLGAHNAAGLISKAFREKLIQI